ncbi:MAG: DUF1924 domain-containing protein [Azoarcus sp.]|jgi:mono/diheme cytochrome c family protein|nr:DUF1924 domain-containing protein [Azoarcus sp.]
MPDSAKVQAAPRKVSAVFIKTEIALMKKNPLAVGAALCALWAAGIAQAGGGTSPQAQLQRWNAQAEEAGQAARGKAFFTQRHGGEWSCASCHGNPPVADGRHAVTGKTLKPLAPAGNPVAFSDQARADKWFRRNCKDVLSRECTPREKADVLAFLIQTPR